MSPASATLVPDLLRRAAAEAPDQVAASVDGGDRFTFQEWDVRSNALARAISERGIRTGDRIALAFDNFGWLEHSVAYIAVQKAGAVAVPMSFRWSEREIGHVLRHSEARGVFAGDQYAEIVKKVDDGGLEWIETDQSAVSAGRSGSDFQVESSEDDIADILYTSGTTGLPKGVASPHGNITFGRDGTFLPGDVFLHAIPLGTFAATHAMTVLPLSNRWTNTVMPRFDPERYCALVAEAGASITYIVPSMAKLIVDSGAPARHDMSGLQIVLFGSSPMSPDTLRRLNEAIPNATLINLYGLTEGGGAGTSMTYDPSRPSSAGKPIGETRIKIVGEDGSGRGPGEEGEIWIGLSPGLKRRSYYRDPEASAQVFVDDWVRTGDIGYIDDEGYLYLVDRAKDIIIRGGYNISSVEVEEVLDSHPAVAECAAVGIPHDVLGEDVAAVVVTRPGHEVTVEELQAWCRSRLADYKIPRRIEFMDALPRNAFLKVLKRELREKMAATHR